MSEQDAELTPVETPLAIAIRTEQKIDAIRSDIALISQRTDRALSFAFEAHQTAKRALWARQSWGPYVVSALAFAMAFAALAAVALAQGHP